MPRRMKAWSCPTTRGNNRGWPISDSQPLGRYIPRAVGFLGGLLIFLNAVPAYAEQELLQSDAHSERPNAEIVLAPPEGSLRVGERLGFHGRWFGIPVGRGWIEVKELTEINGRPAYHIEAQGHSNEFLSTFYPIQDSLHSYLDATTFQPLRFEKSQREGRYRAEEVVEFDYGRLLATYHSRLNHSTKEIPIPEDVHDLISAFYYLRTRPLDPTQPIYLDIYSDEKVYRTEVAPLNTVMLELLWRGTFPCIVFEPKATFKGVMVRRGRVWVYLSAEASRIPLLVKVSTPWGPMTGVIDSDSLSLQETRASHTGANATRGATGS